METKIIGITGVGRRMGCTHLSLMVATHLKSKGKTVAILEKDGNETFRSIAESEQVAIHQEGSFSINGVDYYLSKNPTIMATIKSRNYNYLVVDYGDYFSNTQKELFFSHPIQIVTSGSRPWEFGGMNKFLSETEEEILKQLNYCFMFASKDAPLQEEIQDILGDIGHVYFPNYCENPFEECNFPALNKILQLDASFSYNEGSKFASGGLRKIEKHKKETSDITEEKSSKQIFQKLKGKKKETPVQGVDLISLMEPDKQKLLDVAMAYRKMNNAEYSDFAQRQFKEAYRVAFSAALLAGVPATRTRTDFSVISNQKRAAIPISKVEEKTGSYYFKQINATSRRKVGI